MIPFDPVDVVLCVGNAFSATTQEVAEALFDGDMRRAYYALQDCPVISMAGYTTGTGISQDRADGRMGGKYACALWQIDAPNLPGWDDVAENAQGWTREDAAAWLAALKSHKEAMA